MALRLPLRPRALDHSFCSSCQQRFAFSSTASAQRERWGTRKSVKEQALDASVGTRRVYRPDGRFSHQEYPDILPYPYGPRLWYKQSNRGLYGGLTIRFGNNVSAKNKIKTRTIWRPNIQDKSLYSVALGRSIKVRVATRVLRTIDKLGGLDEYLLGDKPARIKELGPTGWMLRWRLMRTPAVQERFKKQRIAMGLPEDGIGDLGLLDILGRPATAELVQQQVEEVDRQLDEADAYEEDGLESTTESQKELLGDAHDMLDQESEREQPAFMSEEPAPSRRV